MNKQLSDEQIEKLMTAIVSDAALDAETVDQIADAPTLWWAVQREITAARAERSPWPPVLRRWLSVGVPVLAALALVTLFVFRPIGEKTEQAGVQQNVTSSNTDKPVSTVTEPALPAIVENDKVVTASAKRPERVERRAVGAISVNQKRAAPAIAANAVDKRSEIKSDFIALTYARRPDSGQVVRVKVPSSMMVTLGLVSSVEKPSNLVDAEVVVGDDGISHAIRFIR
ncbi:MAG: hypothetical protein KA956_14820 [Pyrinomonadaceae bacterium]|nr:hypothetical protein [Acidobacteriota bacterium]MBP7377740.1 hypothetical protein [Pyrinomonadaceae bacterium]